jgi:hypothetical protein
VRRPYSAMVARGLPAGIRATSLLVGDGGTMAIASVWHSREALDEVQSAPDEPFPRRVLREAGGNPEARFFDVAVEASSG